MDLVCRDQLKGYRHRPGKKRGRNEANEERKRKKARPRRHFRIVTAHEIPTTVSGIPHVLGLIYDDHPQFEPLRVDSLRNL